MPFLRPYSHDREMKQVAAQIIDRQTKRISGRRLEANGIFGCQNFADSRLAFPLKLVFQVFQLANFYQYPALILDLVQITDNLFLDLDQVVAAFVKLKSQHISNMPQFLIRSNTEKGFLIFYFEAAFSYYGGK